ncbi:hypothetical protein [Mesobacillus subterraneus]|uniref:Uncharacterized protein n=1 Tax=Mesobacillus subterraneus TaxID=285983 RepID=A0A427TWC1_9BACI|nr:hypothetical protein [Mesobacillus subterraneus]RSD28650.1 hypothetical protein EJA10_03485 [Mesobacillus subterraneus]
MRFSYVDIKSGNSTCILEINGQKYEFYPSFHSDALGDFVSYLASIHPLCKLSWKEGAFHKINGGINWCTDAYLLRWEFKRDFETLEIIVTENQNLDVDRKKNPNLPRTVLKTKCNFNEFTLCVVKELDRVIKQRGILGYRQEWQTHTFPLDGFLALKHACLYNKPFEITKKQNGTSLKDELNLLLIDMG